MLIYLIEFFSPRLSEVQLFVKENSFYYSDITYRLRTKYTKLCNGLYLITEVTCSTRSSMYSGNLVRCMIGGIWPGVSEKYLFRVFGKLLPFRVALIHLNSVYVLRKAEKKSLKFSRTNRQITAEPKGIPFLFFPHLSEF